MNLVLRLDQAPLVLILLNLAMDLPMVVLERLRTGIGQMTLSLVIGILLSIPLLLVEGRSIARAHGLRMSFGSIDWNH